MSQTPAAIDVSDDLPPRTAWLAVGLSVLLAAALLGKQLAFWQIPSRDACAYYLPIAHAVAQGDPAGSQHLVIPPLYTWAVGYASRFLGAFADPQEAAAIVLGVLCTLLLVPAVYWVGRLAASRRVGVAAAALTAANPWIIRYGTGVGPEAMYALVLTLAVAALLLYDRRPALWSLAGAAVLAGMAPLVRSEGVFLPPLALLVIVLLGWRGRRVRLGRQALHVGVFLALLLVVWWPRLAFMRQASGWYILDERMLALMPVGGVDIDVRRWRPPATLNMVLFEPPRLPRTWGAILSEAFESIGMVITPGAWALAAICLFHPRGRPRHGVAQLVAASVIAGQLLTVSTLTMHPRYVMPVAGIAQIWAGLGLAVLAIHLERMRRPTWPAGRPLRICRTVLLTIVGALAVWSLLMTNHGTRDAYLKPMGQWLARQYGPGRVYVSSPPEVPYYAGGLRVMVITPEVAPGASLDVLREQICRLPAGSAQPYADFILAHGEEEWCPPLSRAIRENRLPSDVLLPLGPYESTGWKLIDVRKFLDRAESLPAATQPAPGR